MDKKERKKLKDFFNKIVDRWKVSSNDSHMGIISFGSNESLIFVLHKKISQCWRLKQKGGGHHISWLNQTWNLHRPFRRSGRESNIYQLRRTQTQSTLGEISLPDIQLYWGRELCKKKQTNEQINLSLENSKFLQLQSCKIYVSKLCIKSKNTIMVIINDVFSPNCICTYQEKKSYLYALQF